MKTNLRKWSTRYQCVIRPKVHLAPEYTFNIIRVWIRLQLVWNCHHPWYLH